MSDFFEQNKPVCPHCQHALNDDEMYLEGIDIFLLAPTEDRAAIICPVCEYVYWIQGGYKPYYTTAFSEEELL